MRRGLSVRNLRICLDWGAFQILDGMEVLGGVQRSVLFPLGPLEGAAPHPTVHPLLLDEEAVSAARVQGSGDAGRPHL